MASYKFIRVSLIVILCFLLNVTQAQSSVFTEERILIRPSEFDKEVNLYLLLGQSNMAGNSPIEAIDTISNINIWRLNKNSKWDIAKEPLRFDKEIKGMGPGLTFAKKVYQSDTTKIIGLIPGAVGGTSIDLWKPGAYDSITRLFPYDEAIKRTRLAKENGVLKAVLWNQGESDSYSGKSLNYKAKLKSLIIQLRKDLKNPDLLFIAGLLPDYQLYPTKDSINKDALEINKAILDLKNELSNFKVIAVKGATDKGDQIHYDSKSVRELGKAYAEKYIKNN